MYNYIQLEKAILLEKPKLLSLLHVLASDTVALQGAESLPSCHALSMVLTNPISQHWHLLRDCMYNILLITVQGKLP